MVGMQEEGMGRLKAYFLLEKRSAGDIIFTGQGLNGSNIYFLTLIGFSADDDPFTEQAVFML